MSDPHSPSITGLHTPRLLIVLVATGFCFLWGLNSPFFFDDTPNLKSLEFLDGATLFSGTFWEFVFSGEAGPTGRPVSLFTFALQASAWPDSPLLFKIVNLLIHILNACLVYLVSFQLTKAIGKDSSHGLQISLFVALAWALHPVHTSTVLYAVQRMALLSNFFMLLGLYLHLTIRIKDYSRHSEKQILWLSLSLAVTGLLALFSKENALSLIFFILTLEYTVLKTMPINSHINRWRALFLWLPAGIAILLPVVFYTSLQADFTAHFSYSLEERFLTQSRILWQYLGILLLPTTSGIGIFQHIDFSTGLFQPFTTFFSLLGWLIVVILAIRNPGKYRLPLFAVLWFFSGHIVESTILPLELFFHHRNYLAFFGFLFILVYGFFTWTPLKSISGRQKSLLFGLYLVLLATNTTRISSLWSTPVLLAERWYESAPTTPRNAEFYAIELLQYGDRGEQLAASVFAKAVSDNPENFRLILNFMTIACAVPDIEGPDQESILRIAGNLKPEERDLVFPMQQIVDMSLQGNCRSYPQSFISGLLQTLSENMQGYDKSSILYNLARYEIADGNTDEAIRILENAYSVSGDSGLLFNLAIQLIRAGRYEEALVIINQAQEAVTLANDIRTGTQGSKLEILAEMRSDVLDFIGNQNQTDN